MSRHSQSRQWNRRDRSAKEHGKEYPKPKHVFRVQLFSFKNGENGTLAGKTPVAIAATNLWRAVGESKSLRQAGLKQ